MADGLSETDYIRLELELTKLSQGCHFGALSPRDVVERAQEVLKPLLQPGEAVGDGCVVVDAKRLAELEERARALQA